MSRHSNVLLRFVIFGASCVGNTGGLLDLLAAAIFQVKYLPPLRIARGFARNNLNMSNPDEGGSAEPDEVTQTDSFDSIADRISSGGDWPEEDWVKLAGLFFDLLRVPGPRPADVQARLAKAFDCLVSDGKYLALHRLILSRHSSEGPKKGALSTVAREFGVRLGELADTGSAPSTGILIALLILRSVLPPSPAMERLPAWHREAIPVFSAEESLLLYNTMFDQRAFLKNVAELKVELPGLDWVEQWREHGLKKVHTLLYYWPAGADAGRLGALLEVLTLEAREHVDDIRYADFRAALAWALRSTPNKVEQLSSSGLHSNPKRIWGVLKEYGVRRVGLGGRRPRVAICVSGQLRGYEAALKSWRQHLLPGLDADFYVHAWTQIGRSGSEPFRRFLPFEGAEFLRCYREQCMKMGYEAFVRHYSNLFKALSSSSEVTVDHLRTVYGTEQVVLEDDAAPEFAEWSNSRKMHYKIAQVQSLVDASGREYDMILRVRPDKAFRLLLGSWSGMSTFLKSGSIVLADVAMGVHYGNLMIGDQIALGSPDTMRIYSAMYTDAAMVEASGVNLGNSFFQGHVSLARQCFLKNIHVGKFPAIFGGLLGAALLTSKEIQVELLRDSAGRMDAVDQILLAAVGKDLGKA